MLEYIFIALIIVVAYSYLLYGLILYVISLFVKEKGTAMQILDDDLPPVTLFVAAYNEAQFLDEKIKNSLQIDYPKDKLKHIWVTDGSDDGTPDIIRSRYPEIRVLHEDARNGKIGAINRGVTYVDTELVVFCDANTYLNKESIKEIVALFLADSKVGCVAGEKKILSEKKDKAAGAGEGIYWKYESFIKRTESKLGSTLGAAGELFALRTELFEPVEKDTILDDFIISLRIAQKGFKIKYAPNAYASETSSVSVGEELKRKVRIASGGIQSTLRLLPLLNVFKYPEISFKFFSHKILRWIFVPFSFIAIIVLNLLLIVEWNWSDLYFDVFIAQLFFYLLASLGYIFEQRNLRMKVLFVPYYIVIMNYAAIAGIIRFVKGNQSVNWARAQRQIVN